ncbi:MAG TPA: thymidine kinase [Firmicutes bacterium]|nr:thymidine kinase [Bacillota bacterium]
MYNIPEGHNISGCIEVICGSMFSGKSEELIRRLRRAMIAKQKVQVFKPSIDNRYDEAYIVSHNQQKLSSISLNKINEIWDHLKDDTRVVGIDEAQFFDTELVGVANELADSGKRVIIAGLDQDYLGNPFEPIPQLLAIAEYITKTLAVCVKCGAPANKSQRIIKSDERVLVGAMDAYEPRCRRCFNPHE